MPEFNKNILATAFKLAPAEAIKFFEKKGFKITWDWKDTLDDANNRVFQVAKAMKMDVLVDIRQEVEKAIGDGKSFADFQKDLEPRLRARGWWGKRTITRPDGTETVQLGSPHRLKTIYRTNVQSAYNAGRWTGQWENRKRRPYLMLIDGLIANSRPTHKKQSGSVQPTDSKFWRAPDSWYPPNGFNCTGRTRPLTEAQAKARGIKINAPSAKPDPGFGGNPGINMFKPVKKDYPPDIWAMGEKLKP